MMQDVKTAADQGSSPPPRLLYTQQEMNEMRKLQTIAKVERHELTQEIQQAKK